MMKMFLDSLLNNSMLFKFHFMMSLEYSILYQIFSYYKVMVYLYIFIFLIFNYIIYVLGFPFACFYFYSKIYYIARKSLSTVIPYPRFVTSPGFII